MCLAIAVNSKVVPKGKSESLQIAMEINQAYCIQERTLILCYLFFSPQVEQCLGSTQGAVQKLNRFVLHV
jgi:hypothetical protein